MIVNEWNEIDLGMFLEIFNDFKEKTDWTKNLILEIQYVPFLIYDHSTRIYVGNVGIDFYKKYNEKLYNMILNVLSPLSKTLFGDKDEFLTDSLGNPIKFGGLDNITLISLGIIEGKKDIAVIPLIGNSLKLFYNYLGLGNDNDNNELKRLGIKPPKTALYYSYYKDITDNKIIINFSNKSLNLKEDKNIKQYIRVRTIDINHWKEMIKDYIEEGKGLKWTDQDYCISNIKPLV